MLPSEIGERTEAVVLAALASIGKRMLVPLGQQRFDLAYEENGRIVKVQCKTGVELKGAVTFKTHSVGRFVGHSTVRDYRDDVDYFGIYCHTRREVYLVPVDDLPRRAAALRVRPARNNQRSGIRPAERYLIWKKGAPVPRQLLPTSGEVQSGQQNGQQSGPQSMDTSSHTSTFIDIITSMPKTSTVELPNQAELPVLCCTPLAAPTVSTGEAESTAMLFKALADPHRVKIVNLLANADDPVCVCEITPYLGLSQATTSFHLKKLVAAGLLTREQRGTWAYYSLDKQAMKRLSGVVDLKRGAAV